MTVQEAIQWVVNIARDPRNLNHEERADGYARTIEACEKLEEIFRLTLKRKRDKQDDGSYDLES